MSQRHLAHLLTLALVAGGGLAAGSHTARAETSVFTQDLTRCITKSVSASDKLNLARWMMAAMAHHPALKDIATVSKEENTTVNKNMADIVQRLLISDCQKEAKDVAKYDQGGFFQSFSVLGTVAMAEIMSNPAVGQSVNDYGQFIDEEKINTALEIKPQEKTSSQSGTATKQEPPREEGTGK